MINTSTSTTYEAGIADWRQLVEDRLRAEDGWLSLIGLYWLHPGSNSIGANPAADLVLEAAGIPDELGVIDFADGQVTLRVTADVPVTVDGAAVTEALLRDDHAEGGPSKVQIGSVSFFIIKRGDEYGVRLRDSQNPARLDFAGRNWFPIQPEYQVEGRFIRHNEPRTLQVVTSTGHLNPMSNPGRVEFSLQGQTLSLEAFAAGDNEIWFVFKDATSGKSTYGAGRFMYAPLSADDTVIMDFNKAYHPPCAFTPFATCPRPLKDNVLSIAIEAGEKH